MWVEVAAECCTSSCTAQPGPESLPELPWPKPPGRSALAGPGPRPPGTGAWEQTGGEEEQRQDQSINQWFILCLFTSMVYFMSVDSKVLLDTHTHIKNWQIGTNWWRRRT